MITSPHKPTVRRAVREGSSLPQKTARKYTERYRF
uniref:Uncharacterized protein n=1 Tax=Anguilla anguilla TaxID=7936 RepID=A0A0E9W0G3_ANGAN